MPVQANQTFQPVRRMCAVTAANKLTLTELRIYNQLYIPGHNRSRNTHGTVLKRKSVHAAEFTYTCFTAQKTSQTIIAKNRIRDRQNLLKWATNINLSFQTA